MSERHPADPCPHPARHGRHEWYVRANDSVYCRACGIISRPATPTHEEVIAHANTVAAIVATWPEWKRRDALFFDGGASDISQASDSAAGDVAGVSSRTGRGV